MLLMVIRFQRLNIHLRMMASLVRHIPQANVSLKSKEWNRTAFVGAELYGKSLGIIGFGRIGSELAKRARAFGMTVEALIHYLENGHVRGVALDVFQ